MEYDYCIIIILHVKFRLQIKCENNAFLSYQQSQNELLVLLIRLLHQTKFKRTFISTHNNYIITGSASHIHVHVLGVIIHVYILGMICYDVVQ